MTKIDKSNIEDIIALSSLQAGLLYHYLKSEDPESYFEQVILDLQGAIEWEIFVKAWVYVAEKNEILRSVYRWRKLQNPLMVILKQFPSHHISYVETDLHDEQELEKTLAEIKQEQLDAIADLNQIPFLIKLVRIGPSNFKLILTNHHIIFDGWSRAIMVQEFMDAYAQLIEKIPLSYHPKERFKSFIQLQQDESKEEHLTFWRSYLTDYEFGGIISRHQRLGERKREIESIQSTLSPALQASIEELKIKYGLTDASLFYTAWGILLQFLNYTDDVLFGVTVSGRNAPIRGIDRMIGSFINALPIRISSSGDASILEIIQNTQKDIESILNHESTPLAEIIQEKKLPVNHELFDSLLVIENFPIDADGINASGTLNIKGFEEHSSTHYPLTITIDFNEVRKFDFAYDKRVIETSRIELIVNKFVVLLEQITAYPQKQLKEINLLSKKEKHQVLEEFNQTSKPLEADNILDLIDKVVENHSDQLAVVAASHAISYQKLDFYANQVASRFKFIGVQPEDIIALYVEPTLEMVICMLGILKAEAAYLPLNPEDPKSRLQTILEDSKAKVIIAQTTLIEEGNNSFPSWISSDLFQNVDLSKEGEFKKLDLTIFKNISDEEYGRLNNETSILKRLVYTIYTSGTTGQPKGALIKMQGLVNVASWYKRKFGIKAGMNTMLISGYYFDPSVEDIFSTLISGATIHIMKRDLIKRMDYVRTYLLNHKIIGLNITPTYLRELLFNKPQLSTLQWIVSGGESLEDRLKDDIVGQGYILYNSYGPTENTVDASVGLCARDKEVDIGKPIDNVTFYILDQHQNPCSIGFTGQLYIGGTGVARGYLNRPKLTAQKFIPNPFNFKETLYDTGDLARWTQDGSVQFKGRKDAQIKISGFRIELGEIEHKIFGFTGIENCCVTTLTNDLDNNYIVAYYISSNSINLPDLKQYLIEQLPRYMVPNYFVKISAIPKSASGKLNVKALPIPKEIENVVREAPRNEIEKKLLGIWEGLLGKNTKLHIDSNFFVIGGNSIKAMSLLGQIQKVFQIPITLNHIFDSPTIKDQGAFIDQSKQATVSIIEKAGERPEYTPTQILKRQYILHHLNPELTSYNMPAAYLLQGKLNLKRLNSAFEAFVTRHDSLRSYFIEKEGEPVQKFKDSIKFEIDFIEQPSADIRTILDEFIKPFQLNIAPLFRVGVYQIKKNEHLLAVDIHHIISDGISQQILAQEVSDFYNGKEGSAPRLNFRDYTVWMEQEEQKQAISKQAEYWDSTFSGEIPVLELPIDYNRPTFNTQDGNQKGFSFSADQKKQLAAIAEKEKSTLFMVLLAAFNAFLARLCDQDDIIVGMPVSRRNHPDLQQVIGMFANTVAIRNYPTGQKSFISLLGEVKEQVKKALLNGDFPFNDLIDRLGIERDASRNPLFDVMFAYNNNFDENELKLNGLKVSNYQLDQQTSKFDLLLHARETNQGISFNLEYNTQLFREETIDRFIELFQILIDGIIEDTTKSIANYSFIAEKDLLQIEKFNKTDNFTPQLNSLVELWEKAVATTPNHIALETKDKQLTFDMLDQMSSLAANELHIKGVEKGDIIAIQTSRSIETVIGILGILKAEAAYLPIAIDTPARRVEYMLQDTRAKFLLTNQSDPSTYPMVEVLDIQALVYEKPAISKSFKTNLSSADLAYIIYTSGSTGKPKGVLVDHGAIINTMIGLESLYPINQDNAYLFKTNFTFDVSLVELFGWMLGGGRLVIPEAGTERDPEAILAYMLRHRITHVNFVPTMFKAFTEFIHTGNAHNLSSLQYVFLAGETLQQDHLDRFCQLNQKAKIENIYGPTEAAVYATYYPVKKLKEASRIPIGKPLPNVTIRILDKQGNQQPIGLWGELCIGGQGLSKGYLNNPAINQAKFSVFRGDGNRIYKTNDIARWLPDGNIEFKGRSDNQVKIRGYRIELGEIESAFVAIQEVENAVAILESNSEGGHGICAYLTAKSDLNYDDLREQLIDFLPRYMVPSKIILLEEFPTTSSGKINRNALAGKGTDLSNSSNANNKPVTESQKCLLEIWKQILKREAIGIQENFFTIGGDSIKALRVVSRLHANDYKAKVKDVFLFPTIAELSRKIEKNTEEQDYALVLGKAPLLPIQSYFFHQNYKDKHYYNQSVLLKCKGKLSLVLLKQIVHYLIQHHDTLRTVFYQKDENIIQEILEPKKELVFAEEVYLADKYTNVQLEEKCKEIQESFDLQNGPLIKFILFHSDNGEHLFIAAHHLVIDVVSWRIILEDIQTLVSQFNREQSFYLPPKTTSYKAWTEYLNDSTENSFLSRDKTYWETLIKQTLQPLIPDFPSKENLVKDTEKITFMLTKEETSKLVKHVNMPYNTNVLDLIVTAVCSGLQDWKNLDQITFAMEGHGRNTLRNKDNFSRTVGWFTSLYPVLFSKIDLAEIGQSILDVKEILHQIPNKGLSYGVLKNNGSLDESRKDLLKSASVSFNFLGTVEQDWDGDFFTIANEIELPSQSGQAERAFLLEVESAIKNNQLIIEVIYNKKQFKKKGVASLMRGIKLNLSKITFFCEKATENILSPSDLTFNTISSEKLNELATTYAIEDILPLTPMKSGLLFQSMMEQSSTAYFEQASYRIEGKLDIEVLRLSLNKLFERHEVLRSNFLIDDIAYPVQIIEKHRLSAVAFFNIDHQKSDDQMKHIRQFETNERREGFNLAKGHLFRVTIFKLNQNNYYLIWSFHHILMDGWSLGVLQREFFQTYMSLLGIQTDDLPMVHPFKNYIEWCDKRNDNEGKTYWKKYLNGFDTVTSIPNRKEDNPGQELEMQSLTFKGSQFSKLFDYCSQRHVTPNIFIQTIWGILLAKLNNSRDVVFGAVVSGRNVDVPGIDDMVDLFINTVPVRLQYNELSLFEEVLKKAQNNALASEPYHYFPLAEIQSGIGFNGALFDHVLVFENYHIQDTLDSLIDTFSSENNGNSWKIKDSKSYEKNEYAFSINVIPGNTLTLNFKYDNRVYQNRFIERLVAYFENIVNQVLTSENVRIMNLALDDTLRLEALDWDSLYKTDKHSTFIEYFQEQVQMNPHKVAVQFGDASLTYNELSYKTNQLASVLKHQNIEKGDIVGLMTTPALALMIGIIGIQKAGAAFLPINPENPPKQVNQILDEARVSVLVTDKPVDRYQVKSQIILGKELPEVPINFSWTPVGPTDPAYVISTSGTTGKPKLILVEHQNLVNYVEWFSEKGKLSDKDKTILSTSASFDLGYTSIFPSIAMGGSLHILPKEVYSNATLLTDYVSTQEISYIKLTPSLFETMTENEAFHSGNFKKLRLIVLGGEKIKQKDVKKAFDVIENLMVVNHYGPAETTIGSLSKWIDRVGCEDFCKIPTIGVPIRNSNAIILGKDGQMVPTGIIGELCILGRGVSRGYLNNMELTRNRFVPLKDTRSNRMYRTGDLARFLDTGDVEFIGRKDLQFKMRGYRIEPAEIENVIMEYPGIKTTVVKAYQNNLLAYLIPQENQIDKTALKLYLHELLPGYKVPSQYYFIDKIPLTANNKINYKALPNPEATEVSSRYDLLDRSQRSLSKIWQEILGLDRMTIDLNSDFFELGGHSLNSLRLVSKIHQKFGVQLSLKDIFTYSTLGAQNTLIKGRGTKEYLPIVATSKKEYYPLSSAQTRFFILQQLDEANTAYNMFFVYRLPQALGAKNTEDIFKKLIARHEGLRISIELINGKPFQKVHDEVEFQIDEITTNTSGLEETIYSYIRPFDLGHPPFMRVAYIEVKEAKVDQHLILVDMHHLISDGISNEILIKEFHDIQKGINPEPLSIQYKDYVEWKLREKNSQQHEVQRDYWLGQFSGEIPMLDLPLDFDRPVVKNFQGDTVSFTVDPKMTKKLRALARESKVTLFMLFLSIYKLFLSRLSGQRDIVVGIPISGRNREELNGVFGCFINSLAIRSNLDPNLSFTKYLSNLKEILIDAYDHQEFPFEDLIDQVNIPRNTSRNPLFDVMFDYHNEKTIKEGEIAELHSEGEQFTRKTSMFDLNLHTIETEEQLFCELEYCSKLFKPDTAERFVTYFKKLIESITVQSNQLLHQLDILPKKEKEKILVGFNDTFTPYEENQLIHQLFEKKAETHPDHTAVVIGNQAISYRSLNEKANQLAWVLKSNGVSKGIPVGVTMERSLEMIQTVLAILKAGGMYVPLEPFLPCARIGAILKNLKASHIILSTGTLNKLSEILDIANTIKHCYLPDGFFKNELEYEKFHLSTIKDLSPISKMAKNNPKSSISSDDFAYIIYTSGSTGKPKGVVVKHKPVINILEWVNKTFTVNENERLLFVTSLGFDLSVYDIFGILASGGCIYMASNEEIRDANRIIELLATYKITFWDSAPAAFQQLVPQLKEYGVREELALRLVFFSGDWIPLQLPDTIRGIFKNARVISLGGATEATIWSNYYPIDLIDPNWKSIPYGRPIQNAKYYILSEEMDVCPIGVTGELYIGGDCLATAYYGNEEKTKERFLDSPFDKKGKIYKTGDLARWDANGVMELLGRKDFQVKIRGHRIELGEIENQLLKCKDLTEALVIAKGGRTDRYLCAYFIADQILEVPELKKQLAGELPAYMIPGHFVQLDKFPINANGKIDRKALPEIGINISENLIAPRNKVDETLLEIWSDLLKQPLDNLSIESDFFEIGGHSLKASFLLSEVHRIFKVKIPLAVIFAHPTIKHMSDYIAEQSINVYERIPISTPKEYYNLSSAQKRLFVLQQMDQRSVAYHITQVLEIEGDLDLDRIERAFLALIKRHESLRTAFIIKDGVPYQKILDTVPFSLKVIVTKEHSLKEQIERFVTPFELNEGGLIKAAILKINAQKQVLVVDIHHIIADGLSLGILTNELLTIYQGQEIATFPLQYKDFSEWQISRKLSEDVKKQRNYWNSQLSGIVEPLQLPLDFPRPKIQSFQGDKFFFEMDKETTTKLKMQAQKEGTTLFTYLFALYGIFLSKICQQTTIVIGTPSAGRERKELENIIGFFVNTLAIRVDLDLKQPLNQAIHQIKDRVLSSLENQYYQFEDLVEDLAPSRNLNQNPIFNTMFILDQVEGDSKYPSDLAIRSLNYNGKVSKFDLSLYIGEEAGKLYCNFEYASNLFRFETIQRFSHYFQRLVQEIILNPGQPVAQLKILPEQEKQKLLSFSKTHTPSKGIKKISVHKAFEKQVKKTPDRTALWYCGEPLSYKALNEYANKVAHTLINKSLLKKSFIAILMEPGFEMFIAMLGILKAGCAYIPLSTKLPRERLLGILEDSQAVLVLGSENLLTEKEIDGLPISINLLNKQKQSKRNPRIKIDFKDLAYLIYTSGTTGKPKGTLLTHSNLINSIAGFENTIYGQYSEDLTLALTASYEFDGSMHIIYGSLLLGNTLCIVPEKLRLDGSGLVDYYIDAGVNIVEGTPTYLRLLVDQIGSGFAKLPIRHFVSGGEKLTVNLASNIFKIFEDKVDLPLITNIYGPTETCIGSTAFTLSKDNLSNLENVVPIGKPMLHEEVYVLDQFQQLLPIGVPGELYIGGQGLGKGYLNREVLTRERFTNNPFHKDSKKLYKTGDLVKWTPEGNLIYLGRKDNQVKIRGYRIEIEEIVVILESNSKVKQAAVVLKKDKRGEDMLVAFLVVEDELDKNNLLEYLHQKLPAYMIPTQLVELDELPRTITGKTDLKFLKDYEIVVESIGASPNDSFENDIEEELLKCWSDSLSISPSNIGAEDDFFSIGGHSLKAMILSSMISDLFNVEFSLIDVFKFSTIRRQAAHILRQDVFLLPNLVKAPIVDSYPLSAQQKRMFFIQSLEEGSVRYNLTQTCFIEGKIDVEKVNRVFQQIIQRHEILRTAIKIVNDEPQQIIQAEVPFEVNYQEYPSENIERLIRHAIKPFDLSNPPMLRVALFKLEPERYLFVIDMHHIVTDGFAMQLLVGEFERLYNGEELPGLEFQYKDFVHWQNSDQMKKSLEKQEAYWLEQYIDVPDLISLPSDNSIRDSTFGKGARVNFGIGKELTGLLMQLNKKQEVTSFMSILAIYAIFLKKCSGQNDLVIGSAGLGRSQIELTRMLGMMTNLLPIRVKVGEEMSFLSLLDLVKELSLNAMLNQDYPFNELVKKTGVGRNSYLNPLCNVMFSFNQLNNSSPKINGLKWINYSLEEYNLQFEYSLYASLEEDSLYMTFEYPMEKMKDLTADALMKYFQEILKIVLINPTIQINNIKSPLFAVKQKAVNTFEEKGEFKF